jgi:pimeloyl-ACP methyl ester carboxylesterase
MGSLSRWLLARLLRRGCVSRPGWPESRIDEVWEHFDQGTQRAILRLHRSTDEAALAAAGRRLQDLEHPALVVWGDQDPWLAPSFADAYAQRLPSARVERIPHAGHWPWLDEPQVTSRVAAFAAGAEAT